MNLENQKTSEAMKAWAFRTLCFKALATHFSFDFSWLRKTQEKLARYDRGMTISGEIAPF